MKTTLRMIIMTLVLATGLIPLAGEEPTDTLLALDDAYVEGWLRDDRSAVLSLFADDAVIIPSGMDPIEGKERLEAFWWPDDGSTTIIESYETTVLGAHVEGALGYLWGSGALEFTWKKDGEVAAFRSESTFTMIGRRGASGEWKIVHRSWSNRP